MRILFITSILAIVWSKLIFADDSCAPSLKFPPGVSQFYLQKHGVAIDSPGLRLRIEHDDPDILSRREQAASLLLKFSDRTKALEPNQRVPALAALSRFIMKSQDPIVKSLEASRLKKSRESSQADTGDVRANTDDIRASTDDLTDELIQEVFQWSSSRYSAADGSIIEEDTHPILQYHEQRLGKGELAHAAFVADLETLLSFLSHRHSK